MTEALKGAKCVAAMTGAGVSTLCGIPDFRGPKGLYRNPDAERIFVRRLVYRGIRRNKGDFVVGDHREYQSVRSLETILDFARICLGT
jgi:NAD-dependent SIR2 family protein deacetylase